MNNIVEFKKKSTISSEEAKQAIKTIFDFCNEQSQENCEEGLCPLYKWCMVSDDIQEYPCNWHIHI